MYFGKERIMQNIFDDPVDGRTPLKDLVVGDLVVIMSRRYKVRSVDEMNQFIRVNLHSEDTFTANGSVLGKPDAEISSFVSVY